jgi:fibronectin-binding autotransporter adhesin
MLSGTIDLGTGAKDLRIDNTAQTILTGDISNGSLLNTGDGVLLINGNNSATANTVSGGTLGGVGIVTGDVTVQTGGALAPGASIGTLTVNGALVLETGGTARVEVDKGNGTQDLVAGLASVSFDGTLEVANLSGSLAVGDAFKLFDAGSYSGSFAAISPAVPGAGLDWDTSTLATGGGMSLLGASLGWISAGSLPPWR